jgi:hypothetical protein
VTDAGWFAVLLIAWSGWFVVAFGDELAGTWIGKVWEWLKVALVPTRWHRRG